MWYGGRGRIPYRIYKRILKEDVTFQREKRRESIEKGYRAFKET